MRLVDRRILRPFIHGFCAVLITFVAPSFVSAGETTISASGEKATVEDHKAAALLYQQEAKSLEAEAAAYEQKAAALSPYQDPKGMVRNGLITAAQERRTKARGMQELYATHQLQVLYMTGQAVPE
jgi:5-deoxy-D-glucuronate isomerase